VAILWVGLHDWSTFLGALFAALLIGLGSLAVSRGSRLDQDSALAILYTAAFSGGIILLRRLNISQQMEEWLFGNIMGLRDSDLWTNYWISFSALAILTALHRPLLMTLFDAEVAATLGVPVRALNYLLLALLIVILISSLQAVGCMLAIGLLVTPAATIYLLTDSTNKLFWGGALLGGLASAFAVLAGWWLNIEQGPAIVLVLGACFLIAFVFGPKHGLLSKWRSSSTP
jgi:ABC-type Mn2+/Zn2+ transport system permease subunit